ncbi:hypothetical protein NKI41_06520 [Mesorhizobium sp. M0601]|uniref:hypothetical protein n=1 Tax=unclassified Mesorhizobium TaxID=325217 RepID=UPI003339930E
MHFASGILPAGQSLPNHVGITNLNVGAARHPPAGSFSLYSDGEKGLAATSMFFATLEIGEIFYERVFLPATLRGEMPGRATRGSVNLKRCPAAFHVALWTDEHYSM